MEQLVSGSPPPGSFGALLRACRHRALLSQEQLAARAELSERTVRNLEAGRVRSPRAATVRLLAGALQLGGPERESWFAAARGMDYQRPAPDAGGPVRPPDDAPAQLDGHTDFRNPGNSDQCASLAGEDLPAAVGLHWPAIADIDGLSPYFSPVDTAHAGCREDDEELQEASALLGAVLPSSQIRHQGVEQAARRILDVADRAGLDGYWIHLDVDILDPSVMPAVDSPDPGGLSEAELTQLLAALAPRAAGAQVTVFDPDLDPDGSHARLLTDILATGLAPLSRDRR